MSILQGLVVLELCEVYQGPLAGQCLGDFGARVIKIERGVLGDPLRAGDFYAREEGLMSSYFAAANRNKESVSLDLKSDAGQAALLKLVAKADILLHNYRPGVMEKLGFGYEALKAINPRLIYAAASGYGETGPLAEMAGQDILIQSISGIASKGSSTTGKPSYLNVPLTDYASGMLLVQGILLALLERAQSCLGQKVTISLLDTAVSMQSLEAASELNYDYETRWFDRALNFAAETSNGWVTVLGFFRENPLQLICQALGMPDLSIELKLPTAAEQLAQRAVVVERLTPAFKKYSVDDVVDRLQEVGVLCAPVLGFRQTLQMPQISHNGMIRSIPVAGQPHMRVIDHPLRLSRTPHSIRKGPPRLGEHTAAVLTEFGLSPEQLQEVSGE